MSDGGVLGQGAAGTVLDALVSSHFICYPLMSQQPWAPLPSSTFAHSLSLSPSLSSPILL